MIFAPKSDLRPANCRNRLRDEGEPYPKSGCDSCSYGGIWGCPFELEPDDAADPAPLIFSYRNHRGEVSVRRAKPIDYRFGATEYHPKPQWLMRAFDLDKRAEREFAMMDMGAAPFQTRVQPWMLACFGAEIAADKIERSHRFIEEALELVQARGCTADEAHQLVDYVFARPAGEIPQEVGGVMVTLAALCLSDGVDMHKCGEVELARVWTKVEAIRAKQAAKPKHSPLPEAAPFVGRLGDRAGALAAIQAAVVDKFSYLTVAQACADMLAQTVGLMVETPEEAAEIIRQQAEESVATISAKWPGLQAAQTAIAAQLSEGAAS